MRKKYQPKPTPLYTFLAAQVALAQTVQPPLPALDSKVAA